MNAPHSTDTQPWPLVVTRPRAAARTGTRAAARRRPDVSGYFTFTLVSALASGSLFAADLLRAHIPVPEYFAFALGHPFSYVSALFLALLAALLAIGDV